MAALTFSYQLLSQSPPVTFLAAYGGTVCLRLYAKLSSQSTAGNYSVVDIKVTKYLTGSSAQVQYSCYQKSASLSGSLSWQWADAAYASFHALSEYVIFERSFRVPHEADGSKTLSLSADYDDSYIAPLHIAAVTATLPTLSRKSEIGGVSLPGGALEEGFAVTFTPAASFGYVLEVVANGETVAKKNSYAGETVTLSGAELLALYRALGGRGTVTLVLHTYADKACTVWLGESRTAVTLSCLGNIHCRKNGVWQRGLLHVGQAPAVVMVRQNGAWRAAR